MRPARQEAQASPARGQINGEGTVSFRKILFSAAAAVLLSGFTAIGISTSALAESVLNRGIGATIGTLDPHVNFLATEGFILDDLYEGLVNYDANGQVVPGAAETWDLSDDGLTYTFHLRDGLRWSNGDPVTAQDFANGIIRTIDPATASDKAYIFVTTVPVAGAADFNGGTSKDPATVGVTAPDARTLVMKLDKPAPYAILLMGYFYAPPLHKPSLDKFGKDFIKPENIVSNGAYTMVENVPQSHVTLAKNPAYWDAASVKIDKVVYKVTEDDNTAVKLWRAGEIDITVDIPGEQIDKLKGEFGDQVHVTSSTETVYQSFNLKKPPFDNPKVREALSLAIDRETLINKVLKGGYSVNCGYVIPISDYNAPKVPDCAMTKEERIAKAKQLFADAGFGPDKRLSLAIESTNSDAPKKMAETIAVMWKQTLGIDAQVHAQDRDSWLGAFSSGTWDVFNDDLVGDFAGPESYLSYMDPRAGSGYNWTSPEFEAAMDKALAASDKAARYKLLADAEKILLDSYLTAPVAAASNRHLVRSTVKGWGDNPPDYHSSRLMSVEAQ
jgi:oligopeptide transport system substrate-binding protein